MDKPKPFKIGHKGVPWFLVENEKQRPTTPKGLVRKGFEPGIYLENIRTRGGRGR